LALRIYLLGLILFLASLVSPAYSPLGAVTYNGWDAVTALLSLRPRMLLDFGRARDIAAAAILAVSGLNTVFVLLSPLFFPVRRHFFRKTWFWLGVLAGMGSAVFATGYLLQTGYLHLYYGYYLWLGAVTLVYVSFFPHLPPS
jgi:hypothetical protein